MEQFDDMLKNSLSGAVPDTRFEFKEEYWLQAQALLEADERKRKRRRMLAYWTIYSTVMATLALCYLLTPGKEVIQPAPVQVVPSTEALPSGSMAATSPKSTGSEPSENVAVPQIPDEAGSRKNNTNSQATKYKNIASYIKNNILKQEQKNYPNNNLVNSQNATKTGDEQQKQEFRTATAVVTPKQSIFNPPSAVPEQSTVYYNSAVMVQDAATYPKHKAPDALSLLPLEWSEIQHNSNVPDLAGLKLPQPEAVPTPITKVQRKKPVHWGITAALSTPSGLFLDERPGVALGLTAHYPLGNTAWTLHADLLWRRWKGNRDFSSYELIDGNPTIGSNDLLADLVQVSSSTQYDFGYVNTSTYMAPEAFHMLDLPLAVRYNWRKLGFESGASISLRLISRTQVLDYQSNSLSPSAKVARNQDEYAIYNQSDRLQTAILGGVHWQVTRHFMLGARAVWNTSPKSSLGFTRYATNNTTILEVSPVHALTAELRTAYLF